MVALIPAAIGIIKGPIGKAVGGFIGKLFKKKGKKAGSGIAPPLSAVVQIGTTSQIVSGDTPNTAAEKVNKWLGEATKDARTFETDSKISPQTIGLLAGAALLVVLVATKRI